MKTHSFPAPRTTLALLLLILAPTAQAQTNAPPTAPPRSVSAAATTPARPGAPLKRLAPLRVADAPGGSRVLIAADAPLTDYAAYHCGRDFCLRIRQAEVATSAREQVSGRGFTSTRVEQLGADLLLTFRLEPQTFVRVSQNFNRLDIAFTRTETTTPASTQTSAGEDERLQRVLARVEELETRVRELEAQRAERASATTRTQTASSPSTSTTPVRAGEEAGAAVATTAVAHEDLPGGHAGELPTGTPRMQIQGYADVNLRASDRRGQTTSFALGQLDLFITSRLSENFSVLGELILQADESNTFSFSIHRLLINYAPRDYFNFSAGRDHTAIGYYNTAYHHGSWFQTAANRPYIFAFENAGGILPLHNVGVSVGGRIPRAPFGLRYAVQVGNGRAAVATREASVQTFVDENNGKAFNVALYARPSAAPGLQTGISFYRDRRTPVATAHIDETITAAHLVYRTPRYELLNEAILIRHKTRARLFQTPAFYTQFSRRFGHARPYFRYQYVNAPDADPLYQPLEVGRRNGPSLGLRYDVTEFAAFKAQYDRTHRRGFADALDELILQLAFTF
ncbi:MAG TPA: hypothetical protein VGV59_02530 [Pyrinomonadaceae bacterium]|nr:hypothetical protein [Pyrinomonadaceae bacterium]